LRFSPGYSSSSSSSASLPEQELNTFDDMHDSGTGISSNGSGDNDSADSFISSFASSSSSSSFPEPNMSSLNSSSSSSSSTAFPESLLDFASSMALQPQLVLPIGMPPSSA